jgi:hypothetical protein
MVNMRFLLIVDLGIATPFAFGLDMEAFSQIRDAAIS